MPKLLSVYIFKEILIPFILALGILSATVFLSKTLKLVELVVSHGVGINFVFWFTASTIPTFLIYLIPIAFLVAVLILCARLSADNEIVAVKSAGLGLFTILRPVAAFAVVAYAMSMAVTLFLFPWGNANLKQIIFDVAREKASSGIEEKTFYDRRFKGMVLYVDHIARETGRLEGVFISQSASDGSKSVIMADEGLFVPSKEDLSVSLVLKKGAMHKTGLDRSDYQYANFHQYIVGLDMSETERKPGGVFMATNRELYTGELREKIRILTEKGWKTHTHEMDLHKRFARPAAVFVFALLAIPLGIQKVRTARLTGFGVAIGVVLIYHIMSMIFDSIGESALLGPAVSVWSTNVILTAAGLYIFYRAAKDKPVGIMARMEGATAAVMGLFKR